jgi:azurin
MRHLKVVSAVIVLFVMVLAVACVEQSVPSEPAQPPAPVQAAQAPELTKAPEATQAPEPTSAPPAAYASQPDPKQFVDFNPNNFDRSNIISNAWLPLKPGTRFTYDGKSLADNGALVPHRIVVNVTDLTKTIGGVRALVTWDQDFQSGVLAEAELAFYAQDKDDNVWYMGEYPEAYENGQLVEAPAWIQGLKGARAGIMMKANPQLGTPAYAEGWGPEVGWTDVGRVDQMGQKTCIPLNCYDNVLVIAESSQTENNAEQLKYYASGVGNVRVSWRGSGEKTKETLELTRLEQLTPEELADVRTKALALEKAAYMTSKDVYARTAPAEQIAPAGSGPDQSALPSPTPNPTDLPGSNYVQLEVDTASGAADYNYIQGALEAPAGSKIKLNFVNKTELKDQVGHNWVLVKTGQEASVLANAIAAGDGQDWLKADDPGIIAHTRLIEGNDHDTITFDAPAPGIYTYLCTFPQHHGGGEKGTLTIK